MKIINFEQVLDTYKCKKSGKNSLSKYKEWFPLYLNPQIAGIVADLMADGHLQKGRFWRMDYCSKSKEELNRLNIEINEVFGYSGAIRPCTTNRYGETYLLAISCQPIGRIMTLCGVPRGAKVLTKFNIPEWIINDKECFRRFIQRLFDCEGCVDFKTIGIELRMNKELSILNDGIKFFETIKENFSKHFNIKTTNPFLGDKSFRKDGKITQSIRMKIRKQSEILKFAKEIRLDTKEKQEKLKKLTDKLLIKSGNGGI
jgi:hypothetical protein